MLWSPNSGVFIFAFYIKKRDVGGRPFLSVPQVCVLRHGKFRLRGEEFSMYVELAYALVIFE